MDSPPTYLRSVPVRRPRVRDAYVSPQSYLRRERSAEQKSEYYDGTIHPMPGASRAHILIASNLLVALREAVRGECTVFPGAMRICVADRAVYTYPDLCVVCGEEQYQEGQPEANLLNPTLVVEVLSPETEPYDRGRKFQFYRGLPSLEEYVLVAQDKPQVEGFRKNEEGRWELFEVSDRRSVVELISVGATVPLETIFAGIGLAAIP